MTTSEDIEKIKTIVPREIELIIRIPSELYSEEKISDYLWSNYHFEIETDPDSDNYEDIFYNSDLRSLMGILLDWSDMHVVLFPKYYASDIGDPDDYWARSWRRLLKNSDIISITW